VPNPLAGYTGFEVRELVKTRQVSAREVAQSVLETIHDRDDRVKAFLSVDEHGALSAAEALDRRLAAGEAVGPLAGVTVVLKDILCTRGQATTCASKMLANFIPPYDAHVVERLRAADAVIVGKSNMDEFAMGSSTENSGFFATRNPWDLTRAPGGSSGGSAAAVAADMGHLALGTDTGGSIRQPAAFCGVVGLKPTYGAVSRYGLIAFASSLDQVGPLAKDVRDAALLLGVIAGHDPRDSTSIDFTPPDYLALLDEPLVGLTVGLDRQHFGPGLDPEIERAVEEAAAVYRRLGARVVDVTLPHSKYAVATYYLVATAEASSNLARYDGAHYGFRADTAGGIVELYSETRAQGFGDEVKRRIMLGTYALSSGYYDAYYLKASRVRTLIRRDFDRAFETCDVLLGPTSPTPAFKLGERTDDPLAMYLSDVYTIACNLAGIAGISFPGGFTRAGLPIGLQLVGPAFSEPTLLRAARMFERETDYHLRKPEV
jgi:aspartyl-tRNA(Asn)/glutamyl-tRNA(Gln) amidotransferase subunit A